MSFKAKILSVDDSSTMRKIVKKGVEALNYECLEAADGNEALSVLAREFDNIKLILLDWNMPGMNGIDFLRTIKKDSLYRAIPVIMVTTEGQKESIIKAVQAGAANYILKPFSEDELTKKIILCTGRG